MTPGRAYRSTSTPSQRRTTCSTHKGSTVRRTIIASRSLSDSTRASTIIFSFSNSSAMGDQKNTTTQRYSRRSFASVARILTSWSALSYSTNIPPMVAKERQVAGIGRKHGHLQKECRSKRSAKSLLSREAARRFDSCYDIIYSTPCFPAAHARQEQQHSPHGTFAPPRPSKHCTHQQGQGLYCQQAHQWRHDGGNGQGRLWTDPCQARQGHSRRHPSQECT
ncbi:hypothetical protein K437DRAFT_275905 [Tilletiaria anomala UBC 951]|uniref:Uncharacterized protein n=1 Tax=Tilletiaria anomala (strain ATCC 24038 / CBS 436.72 / UBC 951) TaxID=1037660 RepID=A0A066VMT3_TILAU|nr:uncharacterized protein K437DRAFT_275905 [Tilletiaria anomala UBC 951]KDN39850.1 hypothetical protein K437DRAFT_275905 [Tilletiaria anomala UBC 951]